MKIQTKTFLLFSKLAIDTINSGYAISLDDLEQKQIQYAGEFETIAKSHEQLISYIQNLKSKFRKATKDYSDFFSQRFHNLIKDISSNQHAENQDLSISITGEAHLDKLFNEFKNLVKNADSKFKSYEAYLLQLRSLIKNELTDKPKPADLSIFSQYQLNNTIWYIYFHEPNHEKCYSLVTRNLLHIVSAKEVCYYTHDQLVYSTGKMESYHHANDCQLFIYFHDDVTRKRIFELNILIQQKVVNDTILLGQITRFTEQNYINTGTIVMQRCLKENAVIPDVKGNQITISDSIFTCLQVPLVHYVNWEQVIPEEIACFLQHRKYNVLKTISSIKTAADLHDFNLKHDKPVSHKERFNSIINYDLFLISPHNSIDAMLARQINTEIDKVFFKHSTQDLHNEYLKGNVSARELEFKKHEANEMLNAIGISKIFYPSRNYAVENGIGSDFYRDFDELIETELKAMKHSRAVLCIFPDGMIKSIAFSKIGWAINLQRTVFVFSPSPQALPEIFPYKGNGLIRNADHKKFPLKKEQYIYEIPNYLARYGQLDKIDKLD